MAEQVLSGVRVLDLSWYLAGPYCTKMLADYGADVIKVEKPGEGDPARTMGPFLKDEPHPEKSGLFLGLNTNKRGITLNLKSATGKKILKGLVKDIDILVESFSPGVMARLGLDYETLEKINPKLVMTSISNFGQTGPYRDFKATNMVIFGMGGPMWATGVAEREPAQYADNLYQYLAGGIGALATLTALHVVEDQGMGQHVDLSMMEMNESCINYMLVYHTTYQYTGQVVPRQTMEEAATGIMGFLPFGPYECKDGHFWSFSEPGALPRLIKLLEMPPDVAAGFTSFMDISKKEEFNSYFLPWTMAHTKQEIFETAASQGITFGAMNTMEDVHKDRQLKDRGFLVEMEHPVAGKLTYPGAPLKLSEASWQLRRPAPLLGEHNEEVYCGLLGYTKEDLTKLRERGVI